MTAPRSPCTHAGMLLPETALYAPVKALLEAQGYTVKSEIGPADVVAVRGDEPPVIVELKTSLTLSLVHQAIDRQAITDAVYLAIPRPKGRAVRSAYKRNRALCRRLGLGLILVRIDDGHAEIVCDPAPYRPRPNLRRRTALLREFARRRGDPNEGGATRTTLVTAYRQDAREIAAHLAAHGPAKASAVAEATAIPKARAILYANHYGWFARVERGIYALTEEGRAAARTDGSP